MAAGREEGVLGEKLQMGTRDVLESVEVVEVVGTCVEIVFTHTTRQLLESLTRVSSNQRCADTMYTCMPLITLTLHDLCRDCLRHKLRPQKKITGGGGGGWWCWVLKL